ncbi:DUF4179 domain-containing protein [Clostridium gasigenes]|uniref:DUF4179 domain-containing protein n=1 Tax=Clostridium gasigenes TaxID=94869 RepID=UPI001C0DF952|nr:DUF4179 domain-containing protein [Clostridium gasigenes]MBU3131815.1 DUF4179 domain-containing protein [Clostridium gasigenes]
MSKDFEIDSFLKNKFKDNDNIQVPNEVHLSLEKVLKNLPEKKKSHKVRKSLIAASVAGILFMGTAITFPAFAESLPLVGDFFKVLNENIGHKNFVGEIEKNSTDIVGKALDSNIEITLMTAVPDNTGITIGYYIKSLDGKLDMPQLWRGSVEIDGKVYEPGIDNIIHEEKEDGHYHITNLMIPDLPEKFNYKINFTNITGIDGNWSFSGSLDKTNMDNQTIEKTLNIEKDTFIGKIEVKSVTKNPLYLKVQWIDHSGNDGRRFDDDYDNRYRRYFKFVRDKNDPWGYMSGWGAQDGLRTDIYTGAPSDLKYMDIIPVEEYIGDPNIQEIIPKDCIGKEVYNGKDGILTITDYKEDGKDKFVKVKMNVNGDKKIWDLGDILLSGEKVNKFGYIVNGMVAGIGESEKDLENGNEVWLKYDGDKFFIEGDRENAYIKEDTENKIRIDF